MSAHPSLRLLVDHRIEHRDFRVWCWIDHLCRTRSGPVRVTHTQVAGALSISYNSAARSVQQLLQLGYLHRVDARPGDAGPLLTIDDPM